MTKIAQALLVRGLWYTEGNLPKWARPPWSSVLNAAASGSPQS